MKVYLICIPYNFILKSPGFFFPFFLLSLPHEGGGGGGGGMRGMAVSRLLRLISCCSCFFLSLGLAAVYPKTYTHTLTIFANLSVRIFPLAFFLFSLLAAFFDAAGFFFLSFSLSRSTEFRTPRGKKRKQKKRKRVFELASLGLFLLSALES